MILATTVSTDTACILCDGPGRPWIHVPGDWRRPGEGGSYRLRWCDRCGFGYLWPRPEDLAAAYQCEYYTHGSAVHRRSGFVDRAWKALAWRLDRGEHLCPDGLGGLAPTPGWVLDVGCGDGTLLAGMAASGWSCVGVEPDPEAAHVARSKNLRVLSGSAEGLDALFDGLDGEGIGEGGKFDLVVMSHVLEHCADPVKAAKAAARRLRPGGVLVCEVPNNEAAGLRLRGETWYWLDVPRHINFFTAASLSSVWGRAGIRAERVEYCGYTRQFGAEWCAAERTIGERLGVRVPGGGRLRLLLRTALAGAGSKYDSVRMVGRAAP